MSAKTSSRNRVFDVYDYIRVNDVAAANLVIVKKDIFQDFLSALPSGALEDFLDYAADRPPPVDDPSFSAWFSICQDALGLNQEKFAEALTETGIVKVSQSNVSWLRRDILEAGLSREKLQQVRTAAERLIREHRQKKNSNVSN